MRQALTLEPNGYEANLFMGFYLQFAGDSALAVEHLQLARRLSPIATGRNTSFLAYAHFMNRDYTEAVRLFTERIRNFSGSSANVRAFLAAGYTLLDRPEEATAAVEKLMEFHPGFNLSQWMFLRSWTTEENPTRVYNAAKKAGDPEYPVSK